MSIPFLPARLLLSNTNDGCGRLLVEAANTVGAKGGTILQGRQADYGTGPLPEGTHKRDIVLTLMWGEAQTVIDAVSRELATNPQHAGGHALVLEAPHSFLWRNNAPANSTTPCSTKGESMQSDHMLLVSITNHGEADTLMEVARKAGARGGTILGARGTRTEDDLKYFGISLAPEKEILLILCETPMAKPLLEVLASQPVFSEPGGGVIFSAAVTDFLVAGRP